MAAIELRLFAMAGAWLGALVTLGVAAAQPASPAAPGPAAAPQTASAPATASAPDVAASAPPAANAPPPVARPPVAAPPVAGPHATAPASAPPALPPGSSWAVVPVHGYGSRRARGDGVAVRNAGIVLLTTMYGLTVIGSGVAYGTGVAGEGEGDPVCTESTAWGFVPLIGPFLLAANYPDHQKLDARGGTAACSDYTTAVTAVSVLDGLVQIGGAAMLIAGLGIGGEVSDDDASLPIGLRTISVPGGAGLAIDGSF